MTRAVLATLLGLCAALAACGRQSELDRPGPLWGAKAKADWEAAHRPAPSNAAATNGIPPLPPGAVDDNAAPGGPPPP